MDRPLDRLDAVDHGQTGEQTAETKSSNTVEWRDISVTTGPNDPATARSGVTDRIQAHAGDPITIETGSVRATLVGVPEVRVDEFVYAHHQRRLGDPVRACALFDIENTGDVPIHWASRGTKFIGTDSYTYKRAHVSLDPAKLGAGCYPSQVEIEPGCRARVITPVEQLPAMVGVDQVVQRVRFRGPISTHRLEYKL